MRKILQLSLICFVLLMSFNVRAYANYEEHFNNTDTTKWIYEKGDGEIGFKDGNMSLQSNSLRFPYVIADNHNIFPKDSQYEIFIKYKNTNVGGMGNGIGVGFTKPDGTNLFMFGIWRGINDGHVLIYNNFSDDSQGACEDFSKTQDMAGRKEILLPIYDDQYVELKITRNFFDWSVYVQNVEIGKFVSNKCNPENIWFGNQYVGGSYDWTTLAIDEFYTKTSGVIKNKVVVIPGMGASWNTKAMIYGDSVSNDLWQMMPMVNNYEPITKLLELNGYVKNTDYWIWNYDWRKSVDSLGNSFGSFVDGMTMSGEKVDIIGHSLGGLIASDWHNKHKTDPRIGKVITLGSPHKGVLAAYEVLNSGSVKGKNDMSTLGLKMYLGWEGFKQGKIGPTFIKNTLPVLTDLLPIFDFAKKGTITVPYLGMSSKNNYLQNISITDELWVAGKGVNSKRWLELGARSVADQVLGWWVDGRPSNYIYDDGDGLVLKNSAGTGSNEILSDHGKLPEKSIVTIADSLNLNNKNITMETIIPKLAVLVASPVKAELSCGNEFINPDNQGWMIANAVEGDCWLSLEGVNVGDYHLVTGVTNEEDWQFSIGKLAIGETRLVQIDRLNGVFTGSSGLDYWWKELAKLSGELKSKYPSDLNVRRLDEKIRAKDYWGTFDNYFIARKSVKEDKITSNMLGGLKGLVYTHEIRLDNPLFENERKRAQSEKANADTVTRLNIRLGKGLSLFGANSYKVADEKLDECKAGVGGLLEDWFSCRVARGMYTNIW